MILLTSQVLSDTSTHSRFFLVLSYQRSETSTCYVRKGLKALLFSTNAFLFVYIGHQAQLVLV